VLGRGRYFVVGSSSQPAELDEKVHVASRDEQQSQRAPRSAIPRNMFFRPFQERLPECSANQVGQANLVVDRRFVLVGAAVFGTGDDKLHQRHERNVKLVQVMLHGTTNSCERIPPIDRHGWPMPPLTLSALWRYALYAPTAIVVVVTGGFPIIGSGARAV
jgi:hypothetical protein